MRASDRPFLLGLTGGIATGKSEAATYLAELGATIIDADVISHALTAPGNPALEPIRERFGASMFLEDGALDRRALGEVVFHDVEARRALEAILHPAIQRQMLREIDEAAEQGAPLAVLVVPLLFESGMDALCDEVWVITADRETQEARLMTRDQLDRAQAVSRIEIQWSNEERERRADAVIGTARPISDTRKEIRRLYDSLIKRLS